MKRWDHIKSSALWLAPLLFISTLALGYFVGSPITISYYNLGLRSEVGQLFALMPFVYFYTIIPLCLFCALGLKFIRRKSNKALNITYIFLCVILVPMVFYGIGASTYYG